MQQISNRLSETDRLRKVSFSAIRVILDRAKAMTDAGADVVPLIAGEPDFPTPEDIKEATVRALRNNFTHYGSNRGFLPLREAIAELLLRQGGPRYDAETEILVTSGGAEAINNAFLASIDPGDEVIVFTPAFVNYVNLVHICGGVPVIIPLSSEDGFQPNPEVLRAHITPRTKMIVLNNPCNPTGVVYSEDVLKAIAAICVEHQLLAFSDEIYSTLVYGGAAFHPLAAFPGMRERTITMNGFSKAYAMTGWRLGYLAAVPERIRQILKIHQYSTTCSPTFLQIGLAEALLSPGTEVAAAKMVTAFAARRKLLLDKLAGIPTLHCTMPEGAFYAFVDTSATGLSGDEFSRRLLEEQHVATVPGSGFGEGLEAFIRLSFATSEENITEGLARMTAFAAAL